MGYSVNDRVRQTMPRAMSLLIASQMMFGAVPAVLAQSAESQTASPSWNDASDIMVMPKATTGDAKAPVVKETPKASDAVVVETKSTKSESIKVKETAVKETKTAEVKTADTSERDAARAESARLVQEKLDAKKAAALKLKEDAANARLEAQKIKDEQAKLKLEAKKAESETIAAARAENDRLKELDRQKAIDAAAEKDKLRAAKDQEKIDQAAAKQAAKLQEKESKKTAVKTDERKDDKSDKEAKELAEAKFTPAQAAAQTDTALIRATTKTEPAPVTTTVETTEAVTTLETKPEATTETTVVVETNGLPAGSILSPEGSKLTTGAMPQVGVMTTADELDKDATHQLGATINEVNASAQAIANGDSDAPMIVDADEQDEVERVIEYENLPTDETRTKIKMGSKFPVVVLTQLSSKTARTGDPIEARLKYDLKIGDRLVAKKGDTVRGHINYSLKARSVMHSLMSPERWYRNSGALGVAFDEIITEKGEHLPLVAAPAKSGRIVNNKAEGRLLGVNHEGQVTGPWSQQLRYKAIRVGLNAAMGPLGVFSFGAMPVALGVIGAANPSFAFMKPVGTNVRHRRIKGFAWGFLSGVPGSFLIEDTVTKGQEAIIKPGDEFLAEFKQEFNGEAASEAQLMPNAQAKVKGNVRDKEKKKDAVK